MNFTCPGCSATQFVPVQDYLGTAEGFKEKQIVSCTKCQLKSVYPFPTPPQIDAYYSTYWEKHDTAALFPLFEAQAASRYEFLAPLLKNKEKLKILDVGAGFGRIRKYFHESTLYDAVEIDPLAVDTLKNKIDSNQIFPTLAEASTDYDLIILSHILEHVTDPVKFLMEIKFKMKPSGIIFVEVPNKDYLYKELNQPHLLFFEPQTHNNIADAAGYELIRSDTCGLNITDLVPVQRRRFKKLRKIVKSLLPIGIFNKIRNKTNAMSLTSLLSCTSVYGGERQWIRVAARIKR